jgi:hypothetical protein
LSWAKAREPPGLAADSPAPIRLLHFALRTEEYEFDRSTARHPV